MESVSSFINSLPKLPNPREMGDWDKAAIEFGIPEIMLMENAGRQLCDFLEKKLTTIEHLAICLFMGGGNNGGDAACMSRHIIDRGGKPIIFHTTPLDKLGETSAWHARMARKNGVIFELLPQDGDENATAHFIRDKFMAFAGRPPAVIVDGLLGTGFTKSLRPRMIALINAVNTLSGAVNSYTLAIDIPSGLNGASGMPSPVCIDATATVTLAAAKPGLLSGRQWTGDIYVKDISMPAAINSSCAAETRLLDGRALLREKNAPRPGSYKNVYGHVLVLGGYGGFSGAAHIAALAALRTGAGLVTACAPAKFTRQIKGMMPEIMTLALSAGEEWPGNIPPALQKAIHGASSIVIGPGMGRTAAAAAFLTAFLDLPSRPPCVVDADALILIAGRQDLLQKLTPQDILTPHPGEAAALLEMTAREVQTDRLGALKKLLALAPAVFVLKGAGTLAGQQNSPVLLCPYDIPQLAIGGAGDALSGCLGALAGILPNGSGIDTAAHGVLLHALAGLMLAREFPGRGALASEIANNLPHVHSFLDSLDVSSLKDGITPWPTN